ncbi:TraR/DksA C4-type zinc finger protein [Paraburkholderia sp. A3RO-2L]|jgi:RNA polymerase-binding transcription factor DksA|uniref:TraR/DksA C4-type zinc finger protein n=1 Tax=unclassified Paraburkholderia TaxID=2615204 RepID=UPI0032F344EB|nr:TraR/DksA C4-type zinc finger protein [Burkholderia vietnamiensis]
MFERHADPIDEAAALAATLTEGAIAAARRANAPETHPDFDGETCIDCGDDIPKERLALGKIRCVHCQTIKERRQKMTAQPTWNQGALDSLDE